MTKEIYMTYHEAVAKYGIRLDADDMFCRFDDEGHYIIVSNDPRCLWTLHHTDGDCDGEYLRSGIGFVNTVMHCLSDKPIEEGIRVLTSVVELVD